MSCQEESMNFETIETVNQMLRKVQTGQMSRRQMLRGLSALGIAGAGLAALGRRNAFARQESSPAAATPAVGPQADGSTLWRVKVGDMKMDAPIELHAFFPGEITVAVGDSIWFDFGQMPMFHTVTFPSGSEVPALLVPDPEVASDATPAGPPKLILNPDMLFPAGGPEYDGTTFTNSGIDIFMDPTQPVIFTFTAEGSFDYLCIPHGSVMQGKVNVVAAGSTLPMDQAGYDAAAAEQMAELYAQGEAEMASLAEAVATQREDGTTLWEVTAGAGGLTPVRIQAFLPHDLEIAAGDTVRWVNRSEGEPHTVTLVGTGAEPPEDTVEQFADGRPKLVQSMMSFLPQGETTFSGAGLANSGFMGIPQLGLPMEYELTFDTPGEYIPYCVLRRVSHPHRTAALRVCAPSLPRPLVSGSRRHWQNDKS
jgi:plastocyanin